MSDLLLDHRNMASDNSKVNPKGTGNASDGKDRFRYTLLGHGNGTGRLAALSRSPFSHIGRHVITMPFWMRLAPALHPFDRIRRAFVKYALMRCARLTWAVRYARHVLRHAPMRTADERQVRATVCAALHFASAASSAISSARMAMQFAEKNTNPRPFVRHRTRGKASATSSSKSRCAASV